MLAPVATWTRATPRGLRTGPRWATTSARRTAMAKHDAEDAKKRKKHKKDSKHHKRPKKHSGGIDKKHKKHKVSALPL